MELLNPIPQCLDCLQSLAKNTALMAADNQPGLVQISEAALKSTGVHWRKLQLQVTKGFC